MATNAGRWTVVAMLSMAAAAPAAAEPGVQTAGLERLERAFWRCDYEATQDALDAGSAMACSVATEAFKARRFGGDFAAMLAWWRANKDANHLALAAEAQLVASTSTR